MKMSELKVGQFARITSAQHPSYQGLVVMAFSSSGDGFVTDFCVVHDPKGSAGDGFDIHAPHEVDLVQTYGELAAEVNNLRFRLEGLEK